MKRFLPILLMSILAWSPPALADFQAGADAVKRGDFKAAFEILMPLVEKKGNKAAVRSKAVIAKRMNSKQITEAETLVAEWKPSKPAAPAATSEPAQKKPVVATDLKKIEPTPVPSVSSAMEPFTRRFALLRPPPEQTPIPSVSSAMEHFSRKLVLFRPPPEQTPVPSVSNAMEPFTWKLALFKSPQRQTPVPSVSSAMEPFSRRLVLPASQAASGKAPGSINVTGTYVAKNGESTTLKQTGNRVTGTYQNGQSVIEGELSGTVLKGRFGYLRKVANTGALIFNFSEDGNSFKGKWVNGVNGTPHMGWADGGVLVKSATGGSEHK